MKLTSIQQEQLRELAFAEVTNKDIAAQMGLPLTEIHAARHRMGITIDKVAAAKGKQIKASPTKTMINKDFETAVQQMTVNPELEASAAELNTPAERHTCMTCNDSLCHARGTDCIVPECGHYQSKIDWYRQVLASEKQKLLSSLSFWGTNCMGVQDVEEIRSVLNKHIPESWGGTMPNIIAAADFAAYVRVQRSGRYNMTGYEAQRLTGLSDEQYEYILNNYTDLERLFGDPERSDAAC